MTSPARPASAFPVWEYIDVNENQISCKAATCTYKNVSKNATRARRHLMSCAPAVECFPGMLDNLMPRRHGDNDAGSPDGGASPFLCFLARVVEHPEADSAPLSSYTGVFACLRATLANHFTGISVAERQLLQGALERRFTSFSDPMVVLAFFLDPFLGPVRGRFLVLRWGGQSLADMRDAAVERLCGGDVSARAVLLADMAGFAAIETAHGALPSERNLHPSLWWRLWGCPFRALQPVAARLLAIPPSAAGGERMFETLKRVLTTRRNRLTNERVDAQSRLIFNTSQLRRPDVQGTYRRPDAEHELLATLDGETGSGAPV